MSSFMKNQHPKVGCSFVCSNRLMRSGSSYPMFSDFMFCFCCVWFLLLVQRSEAKARADPVEVRALNSIFQQWGISALPTWNISGEPCSGDAISGKSIDDGDFNPGIKCDDCSSNNGTTCHIIRLKAVSMDIKGTIPQEIANLPKLFSLNLNENLLTGPLPAFLGNFTDMLYLTVGTNALSGTVPKELGNLRKLLILSINVNNFTGPLPPELGNLTNLEQLYIGSCGLSGEIPSTFANLRNLQTVWAEDNQFTGKLPDFIGKWTSLSVLRIHGSSFEGPIPSTFSNLTSLTDLRLSELYNRSSSLEFIKEMKSLSILILRNCMISGSLPSNMGQYQSLQQLDLSFNNITGELPTSLFSLSSLSFLFLGNNLLSGTLPAIKSDTLFAIDLSYNGLSGSFPSWVNQANLQLNLVGNFFVLDSSNSSGLPTGLNCLQRTFPCFRGSPRYYKFAIKCGGRQIISSRGTVFEQDSENLGAASYYVTDKNNWAVSSTGRFNDNANASYTRTHSSQFTNTLDSELFQTARLSPGSLRYYGLGLENGMYTVNLQFAETDFPNSPVWRSVGKRVFNIFIQGSLAFKDFDIRKEAGGISFRAVSKNFKANVTENFLEIHLFWAGKGTLLVPVQGIYGPSISAVSVTPDFEPTVSPPDTTSSKKKRTGLIAVVVVAAGVVGFIAFLAVLIFRQKRKRMSFDDDATGNDKDVGIWIPVPHKVFQTNASLQSPVHEMPVFKDELLDVINFKEIGIAVMNLYMCALYNKGRELSVDHKVRFVEPAGSEGHSDKSNAWSLLEALETAQPDEIFLYPYNIGFHWVLMVIDPWHRHTIFLDPLGNEVDPTVYDTVFVACKNLNFNTKFSKSKQNLTIEKEMCPQQSGGIECGYYVMRYMRDIIHSPGNLPAQVFCNVETYGSELIDEVRLEFMNFVRDKM